MKVKVWSREIKAGGVGRWKELDGGRSPLAVRAGFCEGSGHETRNVNGDHFGGDFGAGIGADVDFIGWKENRGGICAGGW